eukprot:gene3391-3880_t
MGSSFRCENFKQEYFASIRCASEKLFVVMLTKVEPITTDSKEGIDDGTSFKKHSMYVINENIDADPKVSHRSFRRHSECSYHRRSSFSDSASRNHLFAELFRLNLESKVAMRIYGNHRHIDNENMRQRQVHKWVIHPMSDFRFYWDILLVSILFFQVLVLPVNIAFYSSDTSIPWYVINGTFDVIFLLDIFFNFFTGIPDPEDEHLTILDRKEIRKRYLRSWFILDLFSSLPFDYVFFFFHSSSSHNHSGQTLLKASRGFKIFKLTKMLGLLRLLRLSRLLRYMRKFEEITNITSSHLRIIKLIGLMLLLSHWNGCMQYLVPYLQDFPDNCWVARYNLKDSSVWDKYSWAVFKAMSHMLSIGYGRFPPNSTTETWMILISMTVGGAFYATFIGGISTLSMAIDSSGRQYCEKIEQVNEYLKYRNIPRNLREQVHQYYEHRFQRKCFDEEQILKEISPRLREKILMRNLGGLLRDVPFFKRASAEFLDQLVILLQFEVYLPGDLICKRGRKGDRMYFIEHGVVEVLAVDDSVAAQLSKGSHFGEICILSKDVRRTATVRASTKCDVYALTREHYNIVVEEYPEMRETMKRLAEVRQRGHGYSDSVGNMSEQFWSLDSMNVDRGLRRGSSLSSLPKHKETLSNESF